MNSIFKGIGNNTNESVFHSIFKTSLENGEFFFKCLDFLCKISEFEYF